jgi:hypothetical protein
MVRRYWKTLVAVLGGNLIYFLVLYPVLPAAARHRRNQVDWGLLVDFWVCLAVYGLLAFRFRRRGRGPENKDHD